MSTDGIRSCPQRTPAIARQHAEAGGRGSRDHGLDFVIRPVCLAERRRPRRFFRPMGARVPAMARQIDAAAERQLIVDHDNLLMVGAADGMMIVESEVERREASAIRAAIASTDRARACRVRRSPTSGCSSEAVGVAARHRRAACRAASARPAPRRRDARSMCAVISQPRLNTVLRALSRACRTSRK